MTGPATWGPGVTGTIGAIVRPGGSLQATYDGHPLYTTTADTGPGQTRGNGVWSHGGEWHEVTVPVAGADRRPGRRETRPVRYPWMGEAGPALSVRKSVPSVVSP